MGHSIALRQDTIRRLEIQRVSSSATRVCIELSNLGFAVEIIEQGLAIIFQQILQLKTNVRKLNSDQAKKYVDLSSKLYSGTAAYSRNFAIERNKLIQHIRKQPGLEYFLLPKSCSALSQVAQGGPVVILNSHSDACDGLIFLHSSAEPIHVSLPNVTLDLLESQVAMLRNLLRYCNAMSDLDESGSSRLPSDGRWLTSKPTQDCFADMLAWLWTCVVAPVYRVIESHGIHNGRIWWLLTGAFVGLPLHASPPTDQFIHSYTTTLGSLLEGYAKKSSCILPSEFGIVAVTHTGPGRANYLNGVKEEVEKICSIIDPQMITLLEGEQATPDAVKALLPNCSWVHFACHGRQQLSEPTKSRLLLYNGVLELETILQLSLPNPQFAFLSACETTMGDPVLVNESFHLVGGFIAAGFRGAIGSLWYMKDEDGPLVAEMVYTHMFRDGRQPQVSDAAEALHLAVKELRARKMPYERWMPFIHHGV
ncbi:CHAT domain-containing protein [Mycena leptocephala]|nr:CHAT domain-containing protein [Mycena leptocephala]